ncbi:FecR domain-containing protein [Patescibacteria group bacterium]|nr:FecR domain-containing protein [Patescibacteria group bacterium]
MRRVNRRKKPVDFLLPFLILVSIGIIGVMAFQVWQNWDKQGKADAYFYVIDGKAKILPYAQTEWNNAYSGTKLLLGDALKTFPTGTAVIEFFNGTKVRLNHDTAVVLADLSKTSDLETIAINLDNGVAWIKGAKSAGVRDAHYEVRTADLLIKADGTVFEVESKDTQIVRVLDGDVSVEILVRTNGQERVVDTVSVGVGQEITIDDAALKAFVENQRPSVLRAISDDFKDTDWYKWNTTEDRSPTNFSLYSGSTKIDIATLDDSQPIISISGSGEVKTEVDTINNTVAGDESDAKVEESGVLKTPVITEPKETTVKENSFVLKGTVAEGTVKVVVNSNIGDYELGKFQKGDTDWSYNISVAIGNLLSGENVYKVYAVDKDGNRSTPAKITITYNKDAVTIEDKLTNPVVLTFNGSTSSVVDTDTVTVEGSIKGAEKVVVNGYTLSQFEAGATTWKYVARESVGNLKSGENEYEVYGIDPDGNKSAVTKFTITYNKPAAAPAAESTPAPGGSVNYGF